MTTPIPSGVKNGLNWQFLSVSREKTIKIYAVGQIDKGFAEDFNEGSNLRRKYRPMNSRQRVAAALSHQQPDHVPLDLGGTPVSGMHVSSVYKLRQALKLDPPGTPVKVVEPYQMLGEIAPDLQDALGVDVVGLGDRETMFGFENKDWKPWTLFDGTPVQVPGGFNTDPEPNGDILLYPQGDQSVPPSGRMPKGGYYFDSIPRQEPIDESRLESEDNCEEFAPISDDALQYLPPRPTGFPRRPIGRSPAISAARPSVISRWCLPLSQTPQGHPRRGRVVYDHRFPRGLRQAGLRAAVHDRPAKPGEDLRHGGRQGAGRHGHGH